ncbi:MAG: extracellular solute-binding protein [Eubacteriales bacterium]|nr:extracellular solute-binding protein [Eubacteriales bacterium]
MKKKVLAGALCAAMMAGVLTPAAVSADDMTTLSLWIPTLATYADDAVAEVESAINEYLGEKYGLQVNLEYVEIGNFEQAINLAMTTDEVDVTCYFTGDGQLSTYVSNGQLLDITDYFENASDELKNTFTEAEITASSMNGRMYGLVRKYQYGGHEVALMNKDIVEELGIDAKSITTMEQLEEVLYQVHEAYPDIYTMVPQSTSEMTWAWSAIADKGIGLTNYAYADWGSTELKSLFECEGFAEFCGYMNKWYNDGLIMSDALSNTMEGSSMVTAGSAFCCLHNGDVDPLDAIYPNMVESGVIAQPRAISTDIGNLQYGISANSAHPDEAFTLLGAMYTDPEFATLLAYGIEGEHYVINDKGRAEYPEGMTAETEPYGGFSATATYANFLILPVKETALYEDAKTTVEEWDASVEVSPAFGFFYDTSDNTDFLTAYANLEDKYKDALMTGSIALDDVLPQIKSELESIGFYDVLAETQTALDEYLANN